MKKLLMFLGQCLNPNGNKGEIPDDRLTVVMGDITYGYSLDSDKEEIAEHAALLHLANYPEEKSDEIILKIREQLGLVELSKKPAVKKPARKKVVKKTKKVR